MIPTRRRIRTMIGRVQVHHARASNGQRKTFKKRGRSGLPWRASGRDRSIHDPFGKQLQCTHRNPPATIAEPPHRARTTTIKLTMNFRSRFRNLETPAATMSQLARVSNTREWLRMLLLGLKSRMCNTCCGRLPRSWGTWIPPNTKISTDFCCLRFSSRTSSEAFSASSSTQHSPSSSSAVTSHSRDRFETPWFQRIEVETVRTQEERAPIHSGQEDPKRPLGGSWLQGEVILSQKPLSGPVGLQNAFRSRHNLSTGGMYRYIWDIGGFERVRWVEGHNDRQWWLGLYGEVTWATIRTYWHRFFEKFSCCVALSCFEFQKVSSLTYIQVGPREYMVQSIVSDHNQSHGHLGADVYPNKGPLRSMGYVRSLELLERLCLRSYRPW